LIIVNKVIYQYGATMKINKQLVEQVNAKFEIHTNGSATLTLSKDEDNFDKLIAYTPSGGALWVWIHKDYKMPVKAIEKTQEKTKKRRYNK